MNRTLYPAIFAAIVTLILTSMMLGIKLKTEGINLTLHSAEGSTWTMIFVATAVVFLFPAVPQSVDRPGQTADASDR